MPLLINVFVESCPSQNEHWITSVSAAYLIDSVFGSGGGGGVYGCMDVCKRQGKERERIHICHGTYVNVGSNACYTSRGPEFRSLAPT